MKKLKKELKDLLYKLSLKTFQTDILIKEVPLAYCYEKGYGTEVKLLGLLSEA